MDAGFLLNAADGVPADSPESLMRPDDLVAAIARFLRRIHVPGDGGADVLDTTWALARAAGRVEAGEVVVADLDPPYRPHPPERLLAIATELVDTLSDRPAPDPTMVHGDLALADLRLAGGEIVGWKVPARLAVGDPYVDLVFLARDLAAAIGPAAVPALFDAVGVTDPDPLRIETWITLRQLL